MKHPKPLIGCRFDPSGRYLFVSADGTSSFVNNPTSAMSESELSGRVAALGR